MQAERHRLKKWLLFAPYLAIYNKFAPSKECD